MEIKGVAVRSLEEAQEALHQTRQEKAKIVNDNGQAFAYVYTGNDANFRKAVQMTESYAMVRPELGKPQRLTKVDLYVSHEELKRNTKFIFELQQGGMKPVGFIDNHFSDVLGLTQPDKNPEGMPSGMRIQRMLNGKTYITPEQANSAAADWCQSHPGLAESKEKILDFVNEAEEALVMAVDKLRLHSKTSPQDYKNN